MLTQKDILDIAMRQSAVDLNCDPDDFLKSDHIIADLKICDKARKYLKEPMTCNFVSYGSNVVASVKPKYKEIVQEYINKFEFSHLFETPNMHWLDERISKLGQKVCYMAEYFLPNLEILKPLPCNFELKILHSEDFCDLYTNEWSNALCKVRKELDILGIGAYDNGKLIGLAGCSMDCENMWQIGVDVLPEYRRNGIASSLTSNLAIEVLKQNKVPFYCAAWSNIRSVRNAIKSGFLPSWVEMTVKPKEIIDNINK